VHTEQWDSQGPERENLPWLAVFPGDQKQLIPNGNHDSQLSAVVGVNRVQVAAWADKRLMLNT
jgi:hypothetical protein